MALAFDANRHEYIDLTLGEIVPHITGMLEETGWIDARWYTEDSSERGRAVHQLTADYDLGAIEDPRTVTSKYKGWLLAHVKVMAMIRPTWRHVEEPLVSRLHHYGGRPDRAGLVYAAESVLEVKSGAREKSHRIQTALQAILVGEEIGIPPEFITRYGLYLSGHGKAQLEQFVERRDFDEAYRIIRTCCGVAA
jgi:hypothetical protein